MLTKRDEINWTCKVVLFYCSFKLNTLRQKYKILLLIVYENSFALMDWVLMFDFLLFYDFQSFYE